MHFSFPWNEVEIDSSQYEFATLVRKFNYVKSLDNIKIELNLPPVNMGWKTVPADLLDDSLDQVNVIERFYKYIDTVFYYLDDIELFALNIGNEHGAWLFQYDRFDQFKGFFPYVKNYAKYKYALSHNNDSLSVGSTFTYGALTHEYTKDSLKAFQDKYTDMISVNYYGIDNEYHVLDPSEIAINFSALVDIYNESDKPLFFTECGYPSGDTCSSDETMQKEFIETIFTTWNIYYDHIKYISFFTLTDWSWEVANWITENMPIPEDDKMAFREYLRTLGLRTNSGNSKLAYDALVYESTIRNFGGSAHILENTKNKTLKIHPNPFNNYLFIDEKYPVKTKIFDITGAKVLESKSKNINTRVLQNGIYLAKIIQDNKIYTYKIIKQ